MRYRRGLFYIIFILAPLSHFSRANIFLKLMKKIETPSELIELAVGFQRSQTLFSFVELEIADHLKDEKLTAADMARRVRLHPLAMERFLNACVVTGLLEKSGEHYANTEFTEKFLIKEKEFYLGGQMRRYQKRSYPRWENLTEHLKKWDYGATAEDEPETEDQGADALEEQFNLALLHGRVLAENFDFSVYKNLLDVGGGAGAMSIGLCEKWPHLKATVFDLPENIERARGFVARRNLSERIKCVAGDLTEDGLPGGFDAALLANLLAVFDAETNKKLFKKIYDRLPAGGACLISGWILERDRLGPEISVLFCLEDICWKAPDVERNFDVYRDWLEAAGFREIDAKTYLEPTKLISAKK